MSGIRNILFIMCDQLRAGYLGCYGHPTIQTPNIDALAKKGVRFDRTYVQSPVCGPSRMSFYTGRYVASHGANWNRTPLRIDERTLADYLAPLGVETAIVGKTHIKPDLATLQKLGIALDSDTGKRLAEGGFKPVERDDGIHRNAKADRDIPYNQYLRDLGFEGDNPWASWANSAEGANGELLSAWQFRNSNHPARIPEEHSETAYMTDKAIEYISHQGDAPWCLHLSYIKPHWPYMAPAPYHKMYGPEDVLPVVRSNSEKANPHPIAGIMMNEPDSLAFHETRTRENVVPTYMGLVSQIDAHVGRILDTLRELGRDQDTLVIFTSDHGDFLGDHWLADKAMFYEPGVRIPLIVYDPTASTEDGTLRVIDDFAEAIDLIPTFVDALGGKVAEHRLEGRSLMPIVQGRPTQDRPREFVVSELDYGYLRTGRELGLKPGRSVGRMVRTKRWKYVHFDDLPHQLFDLQNDPNEAVNLAEEPECEGAVGELRNHLLNWSLSLKSRVTETNEDVSAWLSKVEAKGGAKSGW